MDRSQPPGRRWRRMTMNRRHQLATISWTPSGNCIPAKQPHSNGGHVVDMSKISGSQAKVWWFNPRSGSATASSEFPTRGSRAFTPPAEGDWVLVLDDERENCL